MLKNYSLLTKSLLALGLFFFTWKGVDAQISTFPSVEDFETFTTCVTGNCNNNCQTAVANGWVQDTTDNQDWQVNSGSTSSTSTGPAFDNTFGTAAGQYLYTEASGCAIQTSVLTSPYYDFNGLAAPTLFFNYHMYGADLGTLQVEASVGGNSAWDTLWTQTGEVQTSNAADWIKVSLGLGAYLNNDSVRFRFVGITGSSFNSDLAIDDISVVNIFSTDVGVVAINRPSAPFPSCGLTATDTVEVVIENFGADSASNFPVTFRVDGVAAPSETFTGTILSGDQATFTFVGTANLAAAGMYTIDAFTSWVADSLASNDSSSVMVENLVITAYPYFQGFENFSSCGVATGATNCPTIEGWVQGENGVEDDDDWRTISGPTGSGNTGPTVDRTLGTSAGQYMYTEASSSSNELNSLYSPCFTITGLTSPIVGFFYHMYGGDMGTLRLDVSDDGGATWDSLWSQTGQVQTADTDPWLFARADLTTYINQTVFFRLNGTVGVGFTSDMSIDEFYVGEDSVCFIPSASVSDVDTFSAVVNFNSSNGGTPTFIYEYGPAGFTPGTGTTASTSAALDTINGLNGFTSYDVYVSEICPSGDTTAAVGPFSFTTLCVGLVTLGDSISTAIAIPSTPYLDTNTTQCQSNGWPARAGNDVWYTITTGPCTSNLFLSTCSPLSDFDTYLYLLDTAGTTLASNDDSPVGTCNFTLNGLNRFSVIDVGVMPNTTYYIVVDGFGATSIGQYELTVEESGGIEVAQDSIVNVSCFGDTTGSAALTVTGGVGLAFSWDNGAFTEDLSGLGAGTYVLTASDSTGCVVVDSVVITEPMAIAVMDSSASISCFGDMDGFIDLTVSGGTPGYNYAWSNGDSVSALTGLGVGTYTVTITDANGCVQEGDSVTIIEPTAVAATRAVTDESAPGATDGAIDITVTGGTPGYTYVWSEGSTTEDISNLSGGIYCVTITDANGCSIVNCDTVATLVTVDVAGLNSFDVYPNPTQGLAKLNLELAATADVEIDVINVTGQVIMSFKDSGIQNRQYELDLTDQPQGIYLVRLNLNGQVATKSLILSR